MRTFVKFVVYLSAICIVLSIAISAILLVVSAVLVVFIARGIVFHFIPFLSDLREQRKLQGVAQPEIDEDLASQGAQEFTWLPLPPDNSTETHLAT